MNLKKLVDRLLADEETQKALRTYYRMVAQVRYFHRSHGEALEPEARDYDLPPESLLDLAQAALVNSIQQLAVAKTQSKRGDSGSKTHAQGKCTRAMLEDLQRRWAWDGKDYRRVGENEEVPEVRWYDPKYPDPFLYFALKHGLKSWFSVHVRNVMEIVRQAALRKYFSAQNKALHRPPPALPASHLMDSVLPGSLAQIAQDWADTWLNSWLEDGIIYDAILGVVNSSPIALTNFVANGRLDASLLAQVTEALGTVLGDPARIRPKVRALRNKFDFQPKTSLAKYNRKGFPARWEKLKAALLGSVQAEVQARDEGVPEGTAEAFEVLSNAYLLPYLAFPDREVGGAIVPGKLHGIPSVISGELLSQALSLAQWVRKNPVMSRHLAAFLHLYPRVPRVVAPAAGTPGEDSYKPPIAALDLLLAVMQALAVESAHRSAEEAGKTSDPAKSRQFRYYRRLEIKFARLIYAHEYVAGQPAGKLPPEVAGGLRCLVTTPVLLPNQVLASTLSDQVAAVARNRIIKQNSLADLSPDGETTFLELEQQRFLFSAPEETEEPGTPASKAEPLEFSFKGSFKTAVTRIMEFLAAILAVGVPPDNLRNFVSAAADAWALRFQPDKFQQADPFGGLFSVSPLAMPSLARPANWRPKFLPINLSDRAAMNGIGNIPTLRSVVTPLLRNARKESDGRGGERDVYPNIEFYMPETPWSDQEVSKYDRFFPPGKNPLRPEMTFAVGDKLPRRVARDFNAIAAGIDVGGVSKQITAIDARLLVLLLGEESLLALRRKRYIWFFLLKEDHRELDFEDSEDSPGLSSLLQVALKDKAHMEPLSDEELGALADFWDQWDGEGVGELAAFIDKGIAPAGKEEASSLQAWLDKYLPSPEAEGEEAGEEAPPDTLLGILDLDPTQYAGSDEWKSRAYMAAMKAIAVQLNQIISALGKQRKSLVNQLRKAEIDADLMSRELEEGQAVAAAGAQEEPEGELAISTRQRLQKALAALEQDYADEESEFYKGTHGDLGLLCEVVVPRPVRARLVQDHAAAVAGIQLLAPARGNRVLANVLIQGPESGVHPYPRYLAAIADSPLYIPRGGGGGADQNRVTCGRTVAHARIGVPRGDLEEVDVPGTHLAMLLDLWCYGGARADGAPKGSGEGYNTFRGNNKRVSPFHVDEGAYADQTDALLHDETPAASLLSKIRRFLIALPGHEDPDLSEGGFPLAAAAGETRLTWATWLPEDIDPTNASAQSRRAGYSDQLGAPPWFWAGKQAHSADKIRREQPKEQALRLLKSSGVTGGSGPLSRLQGDMTYRGQRNASLRKAMGEFYKRTASYFEICAQPATYALEELDFGDGKERGGLAEIVKKMFNNSMQEFWHQADKGVRTVVPGLKVAFGKVSAFGTSKFHFGCGGVIDRRESSDVGRCRRCGQVVDAHLNASKNIAHDHARYTELVGNNPRDVGGGGEVES